MKSIISKKTLTMTSSAAMLVSLMMISACGQAKDPRGNETGSTDSTGTSPDITASEYLPYYIAFRTDGTPDIRTFDKGEWAARVVDVKDDEFPINAKIKRMQTMTFVTYEGSCEILTQTATGYKKIVIHNDAICAKIKP